jgi:hypothetical protein
MVVNTEWGAMDNGVSWDCLRTVWMLVKARDVDRAKEKIGRGNRREEPVEVG